MEERKVRIYIPKKSKADSERFVSVNGRTALIKTGEFVRVPRAFAEVINESIRADEEAERFILEKSEGK